MHIQQLHNPGHTRAYTALYHVYGLLIGLAGVLLLIWLLRYQPMLPTDLPIPELVILLAFTLLSVLVTHFRIPLSIGTQNTLHVLNLDGAVQLGAMLAAGPVIGGWVAFITGIVTAVQDAPLSPGGIRQSTGSDRDPHTWIDTVTEAALLGGRNVIAIGAAWIAYLWLGGTLHPEGLSPRELVALVVMCLVFVIERIFVLWPTALFKPSTTSPLSEIARPQTLSQFLLEFMPLPVALLLSPVFAQFDGTRFLTLALILIGAGIVTKRMSFRIRASQQDLDLARLQAKIELALHDDTLTVQNIYQILLDFCAQIIAGDPHHISIQVASFVGPHSLSPNTAMVHIYARPSNQARSVLPMHIPLTPFWSWISEQNEPHLFHQPEQIKGLPFTLPLLDSGQPPQALFVIPIPAQHTALVLQAAAANTFSPQRQAQLKLLVSLLGDHLGQPALHRPRPNLATQKAIARQIQARLLGALSAASTSSWQIAAAWQAADPTTGSWYTIQPSAAPGLTWTICAPAARGLPAAQAGGAIHALLHTLRSQPHAAQIEQVQAYIQSTNLPVPLVLGSIDAAQIVTWHNAGLHPPLWWHSQREMCDSVSGNGTPSFARIDEQTQEYSLDLAPGDVLLFYTSGLIEPPTARASRFGQLRLCKALAAGANQPAQALVDHILEQVLAFAGDTPLQQDILLLALKRIRSDPLS